jgi:hypothetical protein
MIFWVFAFAYGRMTDVLSWKPFLILAAISAILTFVFRSPFALGYALEFALNLAGFGALFLLGYGFGRWRARRDEDDIDG